MSTSEQAISGLGLVDTLVYPSTIIGSSPYMIGYILKLLTVEHNGEWMLTNHIQYGIIGILLKNNSIRWIIQEGDGLWTDIQYCYQL